MLYIDKREKKRYNKEFKRKGKNKSKNSFRKSGFDLLQRRGGVIKQYFWALVEPLSICRMSPRFIIDKHTSK